MKRIVMWMCLTTIVLLITGSAIHDVRVIIVGAVMGLVYIVKEEFYV